MRVNGITSVFRVIPFFVGMHKNGGDKMYEIFKKLLDERGVTAYQVAKATGISTGSLSDWKNGRSSPKAEKLQKIADYFGVSVDYLLGNSDEKEKPAATEDDELNEYLEELKTRPEMRMLFSLAKGATKQDVEQAVAIVEALFKARGGEQ